MLTPFPGAAALAQQRMQGNYQQQQGGNGFSLNMSPNPQAQSNEMAMLMALLSMQQREKESTRDYGLQERSLRLSENREKLMMDEMRRERTRNLVGSVATRADLQAASGLREELKGLKGRIKGGAEDNAVKLLTGDLKEKRKALSEGKLTDDQFAAFMAGDFNTRLEKITQNTSDEWALRGAVSAIGEEMQASLPALQGNTRSSQVFGETADRFGKVFSTYGPPGTAARLDEVSSGFEDLLSNRRTSAEAEAQRYLIQLDNGESTAAETNRKVEQLYSGRGPGLSDIQLTPLSAAIDDPRKVGETKGVVHDIGSGIDRAAKSGYEYFAGSPGVTVGGAPSVPTPNPMAALRSIPGLLQALMPSPFNPAVYNPMPGGQLFGPMGGGGSSAVNPAQAIAAQALAGRRPGASFETNAQGQAAGLNTASLMQALLADPRLRGGQ